MSYYILSRISSPFNWHITYIVLCVLQFGMLIEYLFEKVSNWENISKTAVGDLQVTGNIKILLDLVLFLYQVDVALFHFKSQLDPTT